MKLIEAFAEVAEELTDSVHTHTVLLHQIPMWHCCCCCQAVLLACSLCKLCISQLSPLLHV